MKNLKHYTFPKKHIYTELTTCARSSIIYSNGILNRKYTIIKEIFIDSSTIYLDINDQWKTKLIQLADYTIKFSAYSFMKILYVFCGIVRCMNIITLKSSLRYDTNISK